jgi:FlaA1/EpsC-like NDP-sugar epimerase
VDIPIVYTGLRPGEKLYEEKLMAEEGMKRTPNDLIHIGNPIPFDTEAFLEQLKTLMDAAYDNDPNISRMVEAMVDTYHHAPNGSEEKGKAYEAQYRETVAAGR